LNIHKMVFLPSIRDPHFSRGLDQCGTVSVFLLP